MAMCCACALQDDGGSSADAELRDEVQWIARGELPATGKYPRSGTTDFPELMPWQRRQFSY